MEIIILITNSWRQPYGGNGCEEITSILFGSLSNLLLFSIQVMWCPHLYCQFQCCLGLSVFSFVLVLSVTFITSNTFISYLFNVLHGVLKCVIRWTGILSTFPKHRSLHWTTLSSRVVRLPSACPMSSFLIFRILEISAIFLSQQIPTARIHFLLYFHIIRI